MSHIYVLLGHINENSCENTAHLGTLCVAVSFGIDSVVGMYYRTFKQFSLLALGILQKILLDTVPCNSRRDFTALVTAYSINGDGKNMLVIPDITHDESILIVCPDHTHIGIPGKSYFYRFTHKRTDFISISRNAQ
jgi:hypothetical protein